MSRQVYHAMRHSQDSFETGPDSDYDSSDDQSIADSFLNGMALIEADEGASLEDDLGQQRTSQLGVSHHDLMAMRSD